MRKFDSIFLQKHSIIGMIHVQALPGTPRYQNDINAIIDKAVEEAVLYKNAGIDALMIENMHDIPYQKNEVGHEISDIMGLIAFLVKKETSLPLGIQILAGANKAALAAANTSGADFIRAEGFVFGHLADEGYIDSQAAELLRYRKQIGAEHIAVFTDIKKKHSSHAITADLNIAEIARAAEFFLSDGLIVTGMHTGTMADLSEVKSVKKNTKLPVFIGSGVNIDNLSTFLPVSDAMIVGSYFKKNAYWKNEIDTKRIHNFMEKVNKLRS